MKDLLGGKGAGLAEMSRIGLNVPAGFTISTEVCEMYSKTTTSANQQAGAGAAGAGAAGTKGGGGGGGVSTANQVMAPVWEEVDKGIHFIEQTMGRKFAGGGASPSKKKATTAGAAAAAASADAMPLLVSVRSGAAASMPGMMDTVLNLGMNDEVLADMVKALPPENTRFAYDAYRRLLDMVREVGSRKGISVGWSDLGGPGPGGEGRDREGLGRFITWCVRISIAFCSSPRPTFLSSG